MSNFSIDDFQRQVEGHELTVVRDDGLSRHLRFKRPGTYCMHFDLITWPGYLCYTGDMGTYVFKRLDDMLDFFRREPDNIYRIDFRYWAEKLEAADRCDGVKEFCVDKFKAEVRDYFEQHTEDEYDWPAELKAEIWQAIEDDLFGEADDWGESGVWPALRNFEHKDFRFEDWERDCKVYSHRFLWCCHALAWGIHRYDEAKTKARPEGIAR